MDRFVAMEVFVRAVESGSFSAAGDLLNMSPQLVGKHIQRLEQHLGVKLLHRTTRRQSLTDFGRSYYERARVILSDVQDAETLAAETLMVPRGRLRITASVSFGINTLAPKLPDYMRSFPDVLIDLSLSNRKVDLIDEGYDVAFRIGELPDSGLIARPLAPYRLTLCAAPAYLAAHAPIVHPLDLTTHICLSYTYTELQTQWSFIGREGRVEVPIKSRYLADHGEPLLAAARAGIGILLQPQELVAADLATGRLVPVLPDYVIPTRDLNLVYAPDRRQTPKLRSFIDFALRTFS